MSFPNVIYGDYGDEKAQSSTKIGSLPLGEIMVLPDGREFRHAKSGGTILYAGKLYTQGAAVADHGCGTADNLLCTAAAVNATAIVVTMGGTTTITADQYADGVIVIRDDTGEGQTYKIKSNNSAAVSSTATITLEPTDAVVTAIGGTATASLRANPFSAVLLRPAGSGVVGIPAGVPAREVTASYYCWLQRKGTCAGLTSGTTIVIGEPVVADTAVAGAFAPVVASTTNVLQNLDIIGHCQVVSPNTEYSNINLELP